MWLLFQVEQTRSEVAFFCNAYEEAHYHPLHLARGLTPTHTDTHTHTHTQEQSGKPLPHPKLSSQLLC